MLPLLLLACAPEAALPEPDLTAALSGGDTTVFEDGPMAFSLSARNLSYDRRSDFFVGNSFFNESWVAPPASTDGRDGLGPTFNARSCSTCHFHDGRGRPPEPGEEMASMLIRLSVPGQAEDGGPLPDPSYGGQLNPYGVPDVPGEGFAEVAWTEVQGRYDDGEPYTLLKPEILYSDLAFGDFPEDMLTSPRVAPAMIGLGLLAAVPEEDLLALADPDDADGDGVSGRPNTVWDAVAGAPAVGRFGWKANQPDLLQQTAGAFLGDIGITSRLHGEQNCPEPQEACQAALSGGSPEIADHLLDAVVFYSHTLAVPARRGWADPQVLAGQLLFEQAGCAACHVPTLQTGALAGYPELEDQTIHPYTDLLLHDLGEDLADGRPDYDASGSEWRTPPLWGLGLIRTVNDHDRLLHDGRARGPLEAVLWHGGEAEDSRGAVLAMDADERAALLAFLESL